MIITKIDTYTLATALGKESFWSSQCRFKQRKCLLVRIETDTGVYGWGEGGHYGPAEPVAGTVHHVFAPLLLGKDPLEPEVHWENLYTLTRDFGRKGTTIEAISAIDIALWDIVGKFHRAPIYTVMGGKFRKEVSTYATGLYYRGEEPITLATNLPMLCEEAAGYAAAGFPAIKMKIGLMTPAEDLKRVEVVREVVGQEMLIMVDANHAYPAHTACRMAKAMESQNVYWFEEPVEPEDIEGYLQVKAASRIAIATGECEYTRYGFEKWVSRRAVDIIQPDPCCAGGLSESRRIASLASAFHVQCIPHVWGSGIALAAGLQLLALIPPAPHTAFPIAPYNEPMLEWDANTNPLRTDLLTEPIIPVAGKVRVPDGPGLGIDVDHAELERYVVDHFTSTQEALACSAR